MYKHTLKPHKSFTVKTEKTAIIGGETDYCAERFGYRRQTNGISPTLCFKKLNPSVSCSSNNVNFVDYMHHNGLVAFMSKTGSMYKWDPVAKGSPLYIGVSSANYPSRHVTIIDGQYYWIYVSGNYITKFNSQGTYTTTSIKYQLLSTVMHCGRLFGADKTDRYMLRWSGYALNDFTDGIDNSGYVRLNPRLGKLLNLFVLNEKIVIVRERGITTLSTLGDARHMRLDLCDKHELSGIYENSSVICGGQLWIYTKKGMYVYDGNTVKKAPFDEIMRDYVLKQPIAVDERHIEYTATKDDVSCLMEFDTQTGAANPYAKGCFSQFFTENGAFCFTGIFIGALLPDEDDPDRFWLSKPFDFGTVKTARLKSLTVEGSGDFTVEINCDGRKIYVNRAGKFTYAESAHSFTFKVTGNGTVNSVVAEWGVRE